MGVNNGREETNKTPIDRVVVHKENKKEPLPSKACIRQLCTARKGSPRPKEQKAKAHNTSRADRMLSAGLIPFFGTARFGARRVRRPPACYLACLHACVSVDPISLFDSPHLHPLLRCRRLTLILLNIFMFISLLPRLTSALLCDKTRRWIWRCGVMKRKPSDPPHIAPPASRSPIPSFFLSSSIKLLSPTPKPSPIQTHYILLLRMASNKSVTHSEPCVLPKGALSPLEDRVQRPRPARACWRWWCGCVWVHVVS